MKKTDLDFTVKLIQQGSLGSSLISMFLSNYTVLCIGVSRFVHDSNCLCSQLAIVHQGINRKPGLHHYSQCKCVDVLLYHVINKTSLAKTGVGFVLNFCGFLLVVDMYLKPLLAIQPSFGVIFYIQLFPSCTTKTKHLQTIIVNQFMII